MSSYGNSHRVRSGSCTRDLSGSELAAFLIGKIRMQSVHGPHPRLPSNFPKPSSDSPLFCECHFAEALQLDGVQRLENHFAGKSLVQLLVGVNRDRLVCLEVFMKSSAGIGRCEFEPVDDRALLSSGIFGRRQSITLQARDFDHRVMP